jgi:hypothetical protein
MPIIIQQKINGKHERYESTGICANPYFNISLIIDCRPILTIFYEITRLPSCGTLEHVEENMHFKRSCKWLMLVNAAKTHIFLIF